MAPSCTGGSRAAPTIKATWTGAFARPSVNAYYSRDTVIGGTLQMTKTLCRGDAMRPARWWRLSATHWRRPCCSFPFVYIRPALNLTPFLLVLNEFAADKKKGVKIVFSGYEVT
jgi:hypothetical protein